MNKSPLLNYLGVVRAHVIFIAIVYSSVCMGAETSSTVASPYIPDAPIEVLQYSNDFRLNLIANHGRMCQKLLKKANPNIDPLEIRDLEVDTNFAGIITARWRQMVLHPNGKDKNIWNFECVSKVLTGNRLVVISLATYQENGGARYGVELLTRRDIRVEK